MMPRYLNDGLLAQLIFGAGIRKREKIFEFFRTAKQVRKTIPTLTHKGEIIPLKRSGKKYVRSKASPDWTLVESTCLTHTKSLRGLSLSLIVRDHNISLPSLKKEIVTILSSRPKEKWPQDVEVLQQPKPLNNKVIISRELLDMLRKRKC